MISEGVIKQVVNDVPAAAANNNDNEHARKNGRTRIANLGVVTVCLLFLADSTKLVNPSNF